MITDLCTHVRHRDEPRFMNYKTFASQVIEVLARTIHCGHFLAGRRATPYKWIYPAKIARKSNRKGGSLRSQDKGRTCVRNTSISQKKKRQMLSDWSNSLTKQPFPWGLDMISRV